MWDELWVALALMLVIEGIFPFLSPRMMRSLLNSMAQMDDKAFRISGLISMVAGIAMLYWVK